MKRIIKIFWVFLLGVGVLGAMLAAPRAQARGLEQQPTGSIPTVTGTPEGLFVTVGASEDQVNVRSGPSVNYPKVGVLVAGQKVPALGRTPGGDWIQVAYPGVPGGVAWVYAPYVIPPAGLLPIVEPPPTPTPLVTPTIDPTLAAEYNFIVTPTRLPTFTPPPPLVLPTFVASPVFTGQGVAGLPFGFVIIGLGVLGVFGSLISILRGR